MSVLSPVRSGRPEPDPLMPVEVIGIPVASGSLEAAARRVAQWAGEPLGPRARAVSATSVHGIVEAVRDPSFAVILREADLVAPDGMPLVWVGRLMGRRGMERMFGPELMLRICGHCAPGTRHFFYGAAPGVAAELGERLAARFPGVQVAGAYSPPFRPLSDAELDDVAARINASRADIVWVGLSTPKQERWLGSVRDRLRVKVVVSVGAAFDYHTGRLRYAPRWMQRSGLEWLFRLGQEPRRLWRRYAYNNPVFLALALRQLVRAKMRRGAVPPPVAPR